LPEKVQNHCFKFCSARDGDLGALTKLLFIPSSTEHLSHSVAYAQKFRGGSQVSSQSCDVTNKL